MTQAYDTEATVEESTQEATVKMEEATEEATEEAETAEAVKAESSEEKVSIRSEFLRATGVTTTDGENDSNLIRRLCKAVADDIDDDAWNSLSTEAQEFANLVNEAVAKDSPKHPVPKAFPDEKTERSTEEEPDREAPLPVGNGKKKAKPAKEAKPAKAAKEPKPVKEKPTKEAKPAKAAKEPKPAKAPTEKTPRGPSGYYVLKQLMLADLDASTEQLQARLKERGFDISTAGVSTNRFAFMQSLKVIQEAGHLKGLKL